MLASKKRLKQYHFEYDWCLEGIFTSNSLMLQILSPCVKACHGQRCQRSLVRKIKGTAIRKAPSREFSSLLSQEFPLNTVELTLYSSPSARNQSKVPTGLPSASTRLHPHHHQTLHLLMVAPNGRQRTSVKLWEILHRLQIASKGSSLPCTVIRRVTEARDDVGVFRAARHQVSVL